MNVLSNARSLIRNQSGTSAIEYGLIAALVSIGIVGLLALIGVDVAAFFMPVSDTL